MSLKRIANSTTLLFIIVLIVASFFRLYNLDTTPPGLYPDEAMNGNNAAAVVEGGHASVFYPENNGREGLFVNIEALSLILFGIHAAWVLRLVSALFGILTIAGMFWMVREFFKDHWWANGVAFVSSLLMAINFWHINFSRIGFRAIMAPAFLVWSLYFLIITLRRLPSNNKNKTPKKKVPRRLWITCIIVAVSGLLYGGGMHSYISYRATPLIVIALFIAYWRLFKVPFKDITRVFIVFVIFSLIAFAPLGLYFIHHPQDFFGRTSELSISNSAHPLTNLALNTVKTIGMFFVHGDYNWRHNLSGAPELYWPVGLLFAFGLIVEIIGLFKKGIIEKWLAQHHEPMRSVVVITALTWLVIGLLPVIFSNEGIPHALRAIIVIPPVFLFASLGALDIFTRCSRHVSAHLLLDAGIILALMIGIQSYITYFVVWGDNPNVRDAFTARYADIGESMTAMPVSIAKYVVVNTGGVLVNGIPMPAQTVMFLSNTFTAAGQQKYNIHYILPNQIDTIPSGASVWYME